MSKNQETSSIKYCERCDKNILRGESYCTYYGETICDSCAKEKGLI